MNTTAILAGFTAWGSSVIGDWGYLGLFFISMVSSASIILPVPYFAFVFAAGAVLNPLLVGVVAGAGAAIGEMTGYVIGIGGKHVIQKKH